MDNVRFTVVNVNKFKKPVKGFETGRVYSGVRGVVPVEIKNKSGDNIHIGALEAGTSFTGILRTLSSDFNCNIIVLLTNNHVKKNMWSEFVEKHFGEESKIANYYIESSTIQNPRKFLSQDKIVQLLKSGQGSKFITGRAPMQVGVFPLRDYRGSLDPRLSASGAVVVWIDAAEEWRLLRAGLVRNVGYALLALIVIEVVLITGFRLSQRHLKMVIQKQTRKLRLLAAVDGLTGVLNRRSIEKSLEEEAKRSQRHGAVFSIIMFDIDHFKRVNSLSDFPQS